MISTNIDGTSNASSQLFDLLTLVANPAAYQDKIADRKSTRLNSSH